LALKNLRGFFHLMTR